ncbi:uncharacterized protein LOC129944256 [Eupeodes corollae]|uniref:uncharacterized protein LOC129944256 n=1 Tax=Eupeodes corollae TaxID=290404 RepID=UPI00249274CE|nr:uncharacterized protein LOC129944256 [Eupeodes corollae]
MLITRVAPSLAKITQSQLRCASYPSVLLRSVNKMATVNKMSTSVLGREPNNQSDSALLMRSHNSTICKSYSTKQPELPSKQELEKYFFKVTVVIWDLMWAIMMWSWSMCRKHIINNPSVQSNWKTFNEKLEEARKN